MSPKKRRIRQCKLTVGIVALALAAPPTAAGATDTIELRSKVFGASNVDQHTGDVRRGRVLLSWLGVSSFVAAIDGRVVLLDAYVHRGPRRGYVPLTVDEVADLRPERIYMGHGHYDHIGDVDQIARRSGAQLVGTAEHCATMRARHTASGTPGPAPDCLAAMPAAAAMGVTASLPALGDTEVVAVRQPLSALATPDLRSRPAPFVPAIDAMTVLRGAAVDAGVTDVTTLLCGLLRGRAPKPAPFLAGGRYPEGGTLLYRFRVGGFSFVWNDSAAPLRERGRSLSPVLRQLGPIDVHLGAVYTVNMLTNGFRDTRDYVEALRPKVFVPSHHDILGPGRSARWPLQRELDRMPADVRPELRFLSDPTDYARPGALSFPLAGG